MSVASAINKLTARKATRFEFADRNTAEQFLRGTEEVFAVTGKTIKKMGRTYGVELDEPVERKEIPVLVDMVSAYNGTVLEQCSMKYDEIKEHIRTATPFELSIGTKTVFFTKSLVEKAERIYSGLYEHVAEDLITKLWFSEESCCQTIDTLNRI